MDLAGNQVLALSQFEPLTSTELARQRIKEAVLELQENDYGLPMSVSLREQIKRFAAKCEGPISFGPEVLWTLVTEIKKNFVHEMTTHLFLSVPESKRQYFEQKAPLFGTAVNDAFQDATEDIADAGRCFALDQWTACVFHLMRAFEGAALKWADRYQLGDVKNVPEVIKNANAKILDLERIKRDPAKEAELKHLSETTTHMLAIKDAWRNYVAHGKESYDERRAFFILQHVMEFMKTIAR
jgi:hypothetical protein